MRTPASRFAAIAAVVVVLAPCAHADTCAALAAKTLCLKFKYSTGTSNKLTVEFNADGSITLPKSPATTGTWTCAGGLGLVDVEYLYGGTDQQGWYADAGPGGNSLTGNGKSVTQGYMYEIVSSAPGACPAGGEAAAP